jgi:hypothetical protein
MPATPGAAGLAEPSAQPDARPSLGAILAGLAGGTVGGGPGRSSGGGPGSQAAGAAPNAAREIDEGPAARVSGGESVNATWPTTDSPTIARSVAAMASTLGAVAVPRAASYVDPGAWQAPIRRVTPAPPTRGSTPTTFGSTPASARATSDVSRVTVAQRQPIQRAADTPATTGADGIGDVTDSAPLDEGPAPLQRSMDVIEAAWPAAAPESIGPLVSRQADDGGGGGATAGDAGTGGGAAGGTPGAGSEKELDELARKLFPRLQLRLRSELLVDRERVGTLVDFGR